MVSCCGISRSNKAAAEKMKNQRQQQQQQQSQQQRRVIVASVTDDSNVNKMTSSSMMTKSQWESSQMTSSKSHPEGFDYNSSSSQRSATSNNEAAAVNKGGVKKKLRFDLPKATPYITDNTAPQQPNDSDFVEELARATADGRDFITNNSQLHYHHHHPPQHEQQNGAAAAAGSNKICAAPCYFTEQSAITSPTSTTTVTSPTDQTTNSEYTSASNNNSSTSTIINHQQQVEFNNANNNGDKLSNAQSLTHSSKPTSSSINRKSSSASEHCVGGSSQTSTLNSNSTPGRSATLQRNQPQRMSRSSLPANRRIYSSGSGHFSMDESSLMRRSRSACRQYIAVSDGGDEIIMSETEPFAVYEMKTLLDAAEYENQDLKNRIRSLQGRLAEKERIEMEYLNLHKEIDEEKSKRSKTEHLLKASMMELENQKQAMESEMKRFKQQQQQQGINSSTSQQSFSGASSHQEITAYRTVITELRERLGYLEQENYELRQQNMKMQQQQQRQRPDAQYQSARIGQLEVERNQLVEQIGELNEQRGVYERHFQQISAQLVRQVMSQKVLQDECASLRQQMDVVTARCKSLEQMLLDSGLGHLLQMSNEIYGTYANMSSINQQQQRSMADVLSTSTFSFNDADQQQVNMPSGTQTLPASHRTRHAQPPNSVLQQHLQQMQALGMVETEFPADQPSPKTRHHVFNVEEQTSNAAYDKQRMPPPGKLLGGAPHTAPQPPSEMRYATKKTILKSSDQANKPAYNNNNNDTHMPPSSIASGGQRPPSSVTDQELWELYGIPPPTNQVPVQLPRGSAGSHNSTHSSVNEILDTSAGSGPHVYNVRNAAKSQQQQQQAPKQKPTSSSKQPIKQYQSHSGPKPLCSILPDANDSVSPHRYHSASYRRFDSDANCQAMILGQICGNQSSQSNNQSSATQSVSSDCAESPEKCRRGSSSGLSSITGSVIFRGSHLGNIDDDKSSSKLSNAALGDISFDSTDTCITSPVPHQLNSSVESSSVAPAAGAYEQSRVTATNGSLPPSANSALRRVSTDNSIKMFGGFSTTNTSILSTDSVAGPINGALNSTHNSITSMSLNGSQSIANGTPIRQVVKGRFFGAHKPFNSVVSSPQTSSPLVVTNKQNQLAVKSIEETGRLNRPISISDCNLVTAGQDDVIIDDSLIIDPDTSANEDNKLRRVRSETSLPQALNRSPVGGMTVDCDAAVSMHSLEWFNESATPNSRTQGQQTDNSVNIASPMCDAATQITSARKTMPQNGDYAAYHNNTHFVNSPTTATFTPSPPSNCVLMTRSVIPTATTVAAAIRHAQIVKTSVAPVVSKKTSSL